MKKTKDKPKREYTEEERVKFRERMAKARANKKSDHVKDISDSQPSYRWNGTEWQKASLTLSPASNAAMEVAKPKRRFRLFGNNHSKPKVETVAAIIADSTTISDGIVQIEKSKVPPDAYKLLYNGRWVHPLVEINENDDLRYEPWPQIDMKDDEESKLPPENLGMVTYFPEAMVYFVQGKNTNEKLNIALAIGLLVGLGILFFLVFTVGMG